jgi:hypothetical protein
MYSLLTPHEVFQYKFQMEQTGVSQVARAPGGFMHTYLRDGEKMLSRHANGTSGQTWEQKRQAFIKRHLVQYKANKTHRRRLALIAWAYDPK